MTTEPAIILLGPSALATARRLKEALAGSELHGQTKRLSDPDIAVRFDDLQSHLQALFQAGRPILAITAAAIPIRLLAPVLSDKTREPPVIAIAEDGSAVVPLLGGHHGANELAQHLADALGIKAAITTAGDLRLGIALDQPPPGWTIATPDAIKPVTSALLANEPVALDVRVGRADWLDQPEITFTETGSMRILVTDESVGVEPETLVYHPRTLALGIGCERGVDPSELIQLAETTLEMEGLSKASIGTIVSIELKAAEPAIHALADRLGVPPRFLSAKCLETQKDRLANPSELVFKETGCHGVAEGAALAAVGEAGRLVVEKTKSKRATLAVARAIDVIDGSRIGRPQGHLAIIGIGPGTEDWRTPEADRLLRDADHWVGYQGYLDLLNPLQLSKTCHGFPLGGEEDRVKKALDLAASGGQVALISSGDAGIYAMASLAFELLDCEQKPDWQRVEVTVSPGISALQAAAAKAGAPLGHDFCAISLSDLMTPWPVIEQRLQAAAEADFVIALYNPASIKRRQGLARALNILCQSRPPTTPVIIGRNLGRDNEQTHITTLRDVDQDSIDMLSLVIIGSSQTTTANRLHAPPFVYTPRGYLDDQEKARTA